MYRSTGRSTLDKRPLRRELLAGGMIMILILIPMLSSSLYSTTVAFQNGQSASIVIGQSNFTSSYSGENQTGLAGPEGIAIDSKGDVWISDSQNNRVLEFVPPLFNGENASLVLGQENFSSYGCGAPTPSSVCDPQGLAFDKSGDLFVADNGNNRVLEFKPPFIDGESASITLGKGQKETTSSSLYSPTGITFDSSNDLWVADEGDDRVLEFTNPIFNNEIASLVIGQPNFVSNSSGANQTGLDSPDQVAFDNLGDLWVSDSSNSRVLEFSSPLKTGESASVVIGQPNFTTTLQGPTQSVISVPSGLAFDTSGNLWIADTFNGRVLKFDPPFVNGENASLVIGKNDFNSSASLPTQSQLSGPEGVAFDSSGNLWVLDTASNRALEFAIFGVLTTAFSESASSSGPTEANSSTSAFISSTSSINNSQESSLSLATRTSAIGSTLSTPATIVSSALTSNYFSHATSSIRVDYLIPVVVVAIVCILIFLAVRRTKSKPGGPLI